MRSKRRADAGALTAASLDPLGCLYRKSIYVMAEKNKEERARGEEGGILEYGEEETREVKDGKKKKKKEMRKKGTRRR